MHFKLCIPLLPVVLAQDSLSKFSLIWGRGSPTPNLGLVQPMITRAWDWNPVYHWLWGDCYQGTNLLITHVHTCSHTSVQCQKQDFVSDPAPQPSFSSTCPPSILQSKKKKKKANFFFFFKYICCFFGKVCCHYVCFHLNERQCYIILFRKIMSSVSIILGLQARLTVQIWI